LLSLLPSVEIPEYGMTDDRELLAYLQTFLTPQRRQRFEDVLAQRTRWLTVVLEDLYDPHNMGAIARSCDAFGIQDLHVIEVLHRYQPEPEIALGSQQWITVHRYADAPDPRQACLNALRERGYRIAVASLQEGSIPPQEVELSQPTAVVFGTERDGATPEMLAAADLTIGLQMFGFVQSLNVSVAAALCLHPLTLRLRQSAAKWSLSTHEREELTLEWTRLSVPNVDQIERRYRDVGVPASAGTLVDPTLNSPPQPPEGATPTS
jgi:tRNA (guanosine-2'-O-)-methyltransferase